MALEVTWSGNVIAGRQTIWRQLRALRHDPPGPAERGNRKKVFGSALEQSQQLFEAAEAVDYASRPILLFYGLSQAGRAIAAAATSLGGNDYRLVGHGIEVLNLDQRPRIADLDVRDRGRGSFTQLAPPLSSGTLPQGASLGGLWASIPTLAEMPLDYGSTEHRPAVQVQVSQVTTGMLLGYVLGLPQRFSSGSTEQDIADFLEPYPTLVGHDHARTAGGPLLETDSAGRLGVHRGWAKAQGEDRQEFLSRLTTPYLDDYNRWVFPVLGGATTALHPLLAWWAILFALSMLARYEPASWTDNLDVDDNANTVPLEMALGQALDVCPALALRAVHEVST